ncbi:YdeI/OmpD-associated family protein [Nocardioides sp. 1609]|uniref:YdeI/OmpD-associated family protein n=1 Tax=Nocardioides sp. 1609 TaxID=2508327 RepID=UPI00107046A8|nr:YdeI/OmpD-associated family protein [Nocardioides sp. 1609]
MTAPAPAPDEGEAHDGRPYVHPETLEQWRAWLAAHHARGSGVWVYQWRRATGRPAVGYEEQVVEALAWGWIDSTAGTVDEQRARMWFAPRRPTSGWSRPNKQRVERLYAEGRMQPAGRAVLDLAHVNGSWTLLDDVEDLVVPPDLEAALAERPGARAHWDSFPPSTRKQMLTQVVTARKPETRAARIARFADAAARGERGV